MSTSQSRFQFPRRIYSVENHLMINDISQFSSFLELAKALNINLLVLERFPINKLPELIEEFASYNLVQLKDIISEVPNYTHCVITNDWTSLIQALIKHFKEGKIVLASRLTLNVDTIDAAKRYLSQNRNLYHIISITSSSDKVLKWAAHDRRVDYITITLNSNTKIVDKGLCSLMKQHSKPFEILLYPLITARSDRELSELIRNGKRLTELLKLHRNLYVFAMGVKNPFEFRTRIQLRHIANIVGFQYNETKYACFYYA